MTSPLLTKAADGCHKYGWLINLVVMGLMFAYFMGALNQTVNELRNQVSDLNVTITAMKDRVTRLEGQMDTLKSRQ